ncbi:RNA-binding domain-containing protein, partial [Sansalvadorimonas verongulae]|uniref:RNA-binding domain-containing protein n=1 Tax=Sansalvadorimonas verongulae TaxID=2172824 RepID=UPI0012BB51DD
MTFDLTTINDIHQLRESCDLECKLAQGKHGGGSLPRDFWPTYSAFANTQGGDVLLGVKENSDHTFEIVGVSNPVKVIDELWNGANNPQQVSINLLQEKYVKEIEIEGVTLIHIHIPRATRRQRPVYLKNNPITGTYRRLNSSDTHEDRENIQRMMAEAGENSRDGEILKGFGLDDISQDTLKRYRQMYTNRHPDHPWNQLEDEEFLRTIGGWGKDREKDISGLSRAGLLMFGKLPSIHEAFSYYMLDYQEQRDAEERWADRLTLDGRWSGNLFDFFLQVIGKLTADLKVPFVLKGETREDDTPVHKALREAFVNCLVHADYSNRASVLVIKRQDMFFFRNPGLMRVPQEIAVLGGESDCRNRNLHKMFRFVGLGEQAGSGVPKIFQGWDDLHWRKPLIQEKLDPSEQTVLEMHMVSLLPDSAVNELQRELGNRFDKLTRDERLVLVTAYADRTIDHGRMMQIMDIHPHDLTRLFAKLTEQGLLLQEGVGRGTVYFLEQARRQDELTELLTPGKGSSGSNGPSSG